jgi:protoporphyrinogen oxidase
MITILGAGLAGLSCSYHLGHENCILFEKNNYAGGHINSTYRDGFTWDEGPHVSFTKNPYVRKLFEQSVQDDYLEYETKVSNYFRGSWIPHPAQSNLYAVPEPYRSASLKDFLAVRDSVDENKLPTSYAEWLQQAFGNTFACTFPASYTRKYWTLDPKDMSTDWVGQRIYYPDVDTVKQGYDEPPSENTHYITKVRYPSRGGYISFAEILKKGANICCEYEIVNIDLKEQVINFSNGKQHHYEKLINTLPLPEFIRLAINVPKDIRAAAEALCCTSLLLVNVTANHSARHPYHWLYVYDEDKVSTRINQVELLSPNNAPINKTGIQVEVYASRYKPFPASHNKIAEMVVEELKEMRLIDAPESVHTHFVPYANIVFDHSRREAQDTVLEWLEKYGLRREDDDLDAMTDWAAAKAIEPGVLTLAGRFGQWKYFWTDDCVLRGKQLAN